MIQFMGNDYFDDRMFILEISIATVRDFDLKNEKEVWSVITRKNTPGYFPTRTDDFETKEQAIDFYKQIIPQTPLVSMKGTPLGADTSFESFLKYCNEKNIDIELF